MENSRNGHGAVWEIVSAVDVEALLYLFFGGRLVVLDVASFALAIVAVDGEESWNIRMCGLAMVAFVEVVGCNLPVVIAMKFWRLVSQTHVERWSLVFMMLTVDMIELVVVEIELLESLLVINVGKVFLPRHFGLLASVHVHPYEALGIDMGVDWKEIVLVFVEALEVLIVRRLGELAVQTIRPAMISAGEDVFAARLLLDDCVGPMSTCIVESVDFATSINDYDKVVAGNLVAEEVASLLQAGFVSDEEPASSEDGTPLKLVHLLRCVPCCGKGSDCALLLGFLFWCHLGASEII